MPASSTALTTKVESGSPYQLDSAQILKASKALLSHIKKSEKEATTSSGKQSLIKEDDDEEDTTESDPIWLTLTTKKHIIDQKRLKPAKIALPHPLNTSSTTTICLITADPQRTYKDIISSPAFPSALAARITKVVGVTKIKAKFNQYEAQRKLYAEHDIFLADDRIITRLPQLLGKTFYKSTVKRPVPVCIEAPVPKTDGKKIAKAKEDKSARGAAQPKAIANEIEKAIQCALVSLTPSTATSVKVGYAHWDAEKLAANIEAVSMALIEKYVPKKWRGVRAIHVKGPTTASLPIWLADELWVDDADVLGEEEVQKIAQANVGKKRKAKVLESVAIEDVKEEKKKGKKQKLVESNDDNLDKEIAARKEKLKKQKAEAAKNVVADDIPKPSKKSKKGKAKA